MSFMFIIDKNSYYALNWMHPKISMAYIFRTWKVQYKDFYLKEKLLSCKNLCKCTAIELYSFDSSTAFPYVVWWPWPLSLVNKNYKPDHSTTAMTKYN